MDSSAAYIELLAKLATLLYSGEKELGYRDFRDSRDQDQVVRDRVDRRVSHSWLYVLDRRYLFAKS